MNKVLSIFIPTYNRLMCLDRCLKSIVVDNKFFLRANDVPIYISSNSVDEAAEKELVNQYRMLYPHIFYFCNGYNIGADANFDKVYEYVPTKYALFLGDDDFILVDSLEKLYKECVNKDFVFGLSELLLVNENEKRTTEGIYDLFLNKGELVEVKKMFEYLLLDERPHGLVPLLPYFTGVVANIELIKANTSFQIRNEFAGTYHQYIGILWNEALKYFNEKRCIIFRDIICAHINDNESTWNENFDDIFFRKIPLFYSKLALSEEVKRQLIEYYCSLYNISL